MHYENPAQCINKAQRNLNPCLQVYEKLGILAHKSMKLFSFATSIFQL